MNREPKTMKTLQIAQSGSLHPICSPARITLSRRKGWRMPPNTVKVCRPGKWGNPFHVADVLDHYDGDEDKAAADCTRSYRRWVEEGTNYCSDDAPPSIEEIQSELRGKNLACWCKAGSPCHADVLLSLANDEMRNRHLEQTPPEKETSK